MRFLRSPCCWFPLALLALVWIGGATLLSPACIELSDRDRTAHGKLPALYAYFDALSAACSVGLTLHDAQRQYTAGGRWVLTGLGVFGAGLHLLALRGMLARLVGAADWRAWRGAWLGLAVALGLATALTAWRAGAAADAAARGEQIRAGLAVFFGVAPGAAGRAAAAAAPLDGVGLALLALAGLVGLSLATRAPAAGAELPRGAWSHAWPCGLAPLSFLGAVLLAAACVQILERPRGESGWRGHGTAASAGPGPAQVTLPERFTDLVVAAHAGATPATADVLDVREGTRAILAALLVAGGGAGATGGVSWLMLLAAGSVTAPLLGAGADVASRARLIRAARWIVAAGFALTAAVALGLLLIESAVAMRHDTPAKLSEALLDAASAIGGGGLTGGLTRNLTGPHLSSAMGQPVDAYGYGLVWMGLAMFAGRMLPIALLAHGPGAASTRSV